MSATSQPPPAPSNPNSDLAQVIQELRALRSVQARILEELQAQNPTLAISELLSDLPADFPPVQPDEPEPEPLAQPPMPPLFQHLNQCRLSLSQPLAQPMQGLAAPMKTAVQGSVRWLVVRPLRWGVWKPLNYLVLGPIGYGLAWLPYIAVLPAQWILDRTESIENTTWEQKLDAVAQSIEEMGLLKLLDAAGKLAVILAIFSWVTGGEDRAKERQYQAWSMINSAASIDLLTAQVQNSTAVAESRTREEEALAAGTKADGANPEAADNKAPASATDQGPQQTSEGGRLKALQDLYADGQSLAGLQAPGASLAEIELSSYPWFCFEPVKQRFPQACYPKSALLSYANLKGADLWDANLRGSWLDSAILQNASLWNANLRGAFLINANLTGAGLGEANLMRSSLWKANLTEANLVGADLTEAYVIYTNLEKANLQDAKLEGTIVLAARLATAQNLAPEQLENAYLCGAQLPPNLTLDPNRDCEKLKSVLVERGWTTDEANETIDPILQGDLNPPE